MAWCAASKIVRVQMGRGSADWESEAPPPDVELRLLLDISGASCDRDVSANVLKWNGGCVVKVAAAIYDERAFDRMPILADALEDAGCDNADILNHCREPGEHVRGCWVLDLLLGKK